MWISNCPEVLRRWAALCPGIPLPESWSDYKRRFLDDALKVEIADPELVAILADRCDPLLKASVLTGELSETPPNPAKVAEQGRTDELAMLFNSKQLNLTERLRLQALDSKLYDQWIAVHNQNLASDADYQDAQRRRAEESRVRAISRTDYKGRV